MIETKTSDQMREAIAAGRISAWEPTPASEPILIVNHARTEIRVSPSLSDDVRIGEIGSDRTITLGELRTIMKGSR